MSGEGINLEEEMKKPSEVLVVGSTREKWVQMRCAVPDKTSFAASIEEAIEILQQFEAR
jgi:hypothetical protein